MKLYLDSNIVEGTPEELAEYLRLVEAEEDSEKSFEDDKEEEEDSVYDKGAFYIVTDEASESSLPAGAILQHQHGKIFKDSQSRLCIISNSSYVNREHVNGDVIKKERFELAKQLGIQLTSATDFAKEAEGKYFKVTVGHPDLIVGGIVTIARDDKDNQPQCKDKYGNFCYMYLRDLELLEDDEAETASTTIQVGDRVKVLESANGAKGEATVTAVREDGYVEIAGTDKYGNFLPNWSSHVTLLLKIEEEEEDAPMGYTFWYVNGTQGCNHNVLKATLDGDFVDSQGRRYTQQAVNSLMKPVDREDVREEFEKAQIEGSLLKYYPVLDEFVNL